MIEIFASLFERDLKKLKAEIELYQQEDKIWHTQKNITNAAGNLCLHLIGNLNTFIGAELGKTGFVRNRDQEFSAKNIPRETLLAQIEDTINMVAKTLRGMTDEEMNKDYPQNVLGYKMTTAYFLTHLATHLTYHLGQINYHRRLLDV